MAGTTAMMSFKPPPGDDNIARIVLIQTALKELALSLMFLLPVLCLTRFATVVYLLTTTAPGDDDSRLTKLLTSKTTACLAEKDGSKIAEPSLVSTNELDFCGREPIRPVHVPVVVKECFRKIDVLALDGSFEIFVVEYKKGAIAPVVNDLGCHGLLPFIGKGRAATPVLWVGVRKHGD